MLARVRGSRTHLIPLRQCRQFQRLQLHALASVAKLKPTERTPVPDGLVMDTVGPLRITLVVRTPTSGPGKAWYIYGSLMGSLRLMGYAF
jgi:hypothetical protein